MIVSKPAPMREDIGPGQVEANAASVHVAISDRAMQRFYTMPTTFAFPARATGQEARRPATCSSSQIGTIWTICAVRCKISTSPMNSMRQITGGLFGIPLDRIEQARTG
jgi:hypothetical protein